MIRSLFWYVYRSYLLVIGIAVLPLAWLVATLEVQQNSGASFEWLSFFVLSAVVAAAVVSIIVTRRILSPLDRIRRGAERFSKGQLRSRIYPSQVSELGALAESLNLMASQLEDRFDAIVRQRNEQEIVLSSMIEGVIAVDREDKIIRINSAAKDLFGVALDASVGRSIEEVVRNASLLEFLRKSRGAGVATDGEIVVPGSPERILLVHASTLQDEQGEDSGILLVFHDISKLRRLENVRRDFVANVSHELKTPITSIKGFVETLLDGAMHNPDDLRRFLLIISQHVDRLDAIFNDLLTLSRLEQDGETIVELQQLPLKDTLLSAVEACRGRAETKGLHISLDCEESLEAEINPSLFEQAVVNLLDNAIKYSGPSGTIDVKALRTEREVVVTVKDRGIGIEQRHQARIFERFYRVDAARSRKMGGTGLGLAIVKHIAQAHGGFATVESRLGSGSAFSLHLPRE